MTNAQNPISNLFKKFLDIFKNLTRGNGRHDGIKIDNTSQRAGIDVSLPLFYICLGFPSCVLFIPYKRNLILVCAIVIMILAERLIL